jgi:hypothetical protein
MLESIYAGKYINPSVTGFKFKLLPWREGVRGGAFG